MKPLGEVRLELERLPRVPLWRLALARKAGLTAGVRLPTVRARVRRVRLGDSAAYRDLCGVPADGPLPLLWPFVVAAPLQKAALIRPEFPVPLLGMVHLRQSVWAARPLDPREPVDLAVALGTWRPARRGVEFDLRTELTDASGAPVWSGTTTAWSPHGPGHGEDRPRPQPPALAPGLERSVVVPEWMGRRYGKVAGDGNPIHMHAWTARPFGFRRAIVHGMWTLARVLAELGPRVPAEGPTVHAWFRKPVFLPDTVTVRAGPRLERPPSGASAHDAATDPARAADAPWGFRVDGDDRCRLWGTIDPGHAPPASGSEG